MEFVAVASDKRQIPANLGYGFTADLESTSTKKCHDCEEIWYKFIDSNSVVRCWICFAEQTGPYNCDNCGKDGILIRDLHDCERDTPGFNPNKNFKVVYCGPVEVNGIQQEMFAIERIRDSKFMQGFSSDNPAVAFRSAAEVCRRDANFSDF